MNIEIWSDIVCPWCYIGKRRLEAALRDMDSEARTTFRSYQLDPSPVPEPRPLVDALADKFGGTERAKQMIASVSAVATGDGLTLDFGSAVAANTFDAHRLIAWADEQGHQLDMVEALHRAHFTDGVDLGSRTALAAVAAGIGLDEAAAQTYLHGAGSVDRVRADMTEARRLGIGSVPTFVINNKYAVTGAQDVTTLRSTFEEINRREAD